MKLNNYQKIQITWAVLIAGGYLLSNVILGAYGSLFLLWVGISVVGLGVQFVLGKPTDTKAWAIQLLWAGIVILGSLLTVLEFRGILVVGLKGMVSGWFFLCAGGMAITAVIYRFNISYLLLAGLYGLVGVYLATNELLLYHAVTISAVAFFVLCIGDAALEKSPWRSKLAE